MSMYLNVLKWNRPIALGAVLALNASLAEPVVNATARVQSSLIAPLTRHVGRPSLAPDAPITGIIVLGGGFERTREGARLSRLYPEAILVVSGANPQDYSYAEANAAGPGRVLIEPNAKTTFENARFTKRLLAPKPGERWLLVTSASHMRRAYATFKGADFPVIPWPVDDMAAGSPATAGQATHEMLGLIGYRLLGRTRELWPSLMPPRQRTRA